MDKELIEREFNRIKQLGFIKSRRCNSTGIGKTFEDYLGVNENNDRAPDFAGFEVKSKRNNTSSYLTLFTKSPSFPKKANTYLRDKYGVQYPKNPNLKKLHTSMFSDKHNSYMGLFGFKLINDTKEQKIGIEIKNLETEEVDNTPYWTYTELNTCLFKKLKALFIVFADTRNENGSEYFHYKNAEVYLKPSLGKLLQLIDEGKIMVDIRIGSYKSGKNMGKAHDHGTGFRIKPDDLYSLYEEKIEIE